MTKRLYFIVEDSPKSGVVIGIYAKSEAEIRKRLNHPHSSIYVETDMDLPTWVDKKHTPRFDIDEDEERLNNPFGKI